MEWFEMMELMLRTVSPFAVKKSYREGREEREGRGILVI
jgi:hypothetical protein